MFSKLSHTIYNYTLAPTINKISDKVTEGVNSLNDFFQLCLEKLKSLSTKFAHASKIFNLIMSAYDMISALSYSICISFSTGTMTPVLPISVMMRIVGFATQLYTFISDISPILFPPTPKEPTNPPIEHFYEAEEVEPQAGSLESMLASLLMSSFLPTSIQHILKGLTMYSSLRICDDIEQIYSFIGYIISIPRRILSAILPVTTMTIFIIDLLKDFENCLPFSTGSLLAKKMDAEILRAKKTPILLSDTLFQTTFITMFTEFEAFKDSILKIRTHLPPHIDVTYRDGLRMFKKIKNVMSTTRVEPVAIVFNGPPGTGKSVLQSKLLEAFKKTQTVYSHGSIADPLKDFHDMYDNEDVYSVEDIGQKGTAQWANIINFVSPMKYPLQCAAVDQKGSKYFTSKVIIMSTNNINPTLTADCGISDIGALHRRLHNFDFHDVKFENGVYRGDIRVKRYRLDTRAFEETRRISPVNGQFDLLTIYNYISQELQTNINNYTRNLPNNQQDFPPLPVEAQSNDTSSYWNKELFAEIFDRMADALRGMAFGASLAMLGIVIPRALDDYDRFIVESIVQRRRQLVENFPEMEENIDTIFLTTSNWTRVKVFFTATLLELGKDEMYNGAMFILSLQLLAAGCNAFSQYLRTPPTPDLTYIPGFREEKKVRTDIQTVIPQGLDELFALKVDTTYPQALNPLVKNTKAIKFDYLVGDVPHTSTCVTVISGKYFLTPAHAVDPNSLENFVTVYYSPTQIMYDHVKVKMEYYNVKDDIAIWSLPLGLPNLLSKITFIVTSKNYTSYLITPTGAKQLNDVKAADFRMRYARNNYNNMIDLGDAVVYQDQCESLCGSLFVNGDGKILGHHVAAHKDGEGNPIGITRIFTRDTQAAIQRYFSKSAEYAYELKDEQFSQDNLVSGLRIQGEAPLFVSTKNTIVPSQVHGIFENQRSPANLNKPTEKIAKKANELLIPCQTIDLTIVPKLRRLNKRLFDGLKYRVLTDFENIKGTPLLGPIDKDTSIGYGLQGLKTDYMDFELGQFKPQMLEILRKTEERIEQGYPIEYMFKECLKMELRDNEKVDKPRMFDASPLVHTILVRRYFGCMLEHLRVNRNDNLIMIGVNPLSKQWHDLAKRLSTFQDGTTTDAFASLDTKTFDGTMNSTIQGICCDAWLDEIPKQHLKIASHIMRVVIMTPTVSYDGIRMSTHGQPSGVGITADMNSAVTRSYLAYSYFKVFPNKDYLDFICEVNSATYGDDNTTGFHNRIKEDFNAVVIKQEMEKIGITMTPASKTGEVVKYGPLDEQSFLKRSFKVNKLFLATFGPNYCITGALEPKSMESTLNWVSDQFRNEELTNVKLLNFQREAFLHDNYVEYMTHISQFLTKQGYAQPPWLSTSDLLYLYSNNLVQPGEFCLS